MKHFYVLVIWRRITLTLLSSFEFQLYPPAGVGATYPEVDSPGKWGGKSAENVKETGAKKLLAHLMFTNTWAVKVVILWTVHAAIRLEGELILRRCSFDVQCHVSSPVYVFSANVFPFIRTHRYPVHRARPRSCCSCYSTQAPSCQQQVVRIQVLIMKPA